MSWDQVFDFIVHILHEYFFGIRSRWRIEPKKIPSSVNYKTKQVFVIFLNRKQLAFKKLNHM